MTHYFLGPRLLGSSPRLPLWSDTQPETHNLALFCPTCGEAWGRVVIGPDAEWLPIRAGCPSHPWTDIGGTFIHPWLRSFDHLPTEVLTHEFILRLPQAA